MPRPPAVRLPRPFPLLLSPILLAALTLFPAARAQNSLADPAGQLSSPAVENRVDALLSQMTLEEKIGQLVQYSAGQATGPGAGRTDDRDMLARGQIGSLFNVTGAEKTNSLQHIAVEKSRLHIPILFGLDVIHGYRTIFPIPLALAATWDPSVVETTAHIAAWEAYAGGIRWTFSPMVDIARDARWGRIAEGAGEDPYLGSVMARAYVRGYQGERLGAPGAIAACVKHYVGYGAAEAGREYNSAELSEHTLRQFYLPPFHAAEEAGAATFMSAFNTINGVPASANQFTLKDILKNEWGFKGFVVSDWTSIAELIAHGVASDGVTAARKALLAGVDMDMVSNLYHAYLPGLVKSGQVPESAIDDAARRVLRVKFALGLFDHPYTAPENENAAMLRPESVALARKAAAESFVLLRNEPVNGAPLLPLAASGRHIALIGPLADDARSMLGSWPGLGRPEDAVTLRKALSDRIGAGNLSWSKGAGYLEASDAGIAAAVQSARKADLVVLALGENGPEMTGEAASRAHLGLPGRQEELLEKIVATGKPVVLVLFSGRPLTLPWAFSHVPAVLAAWFPGLQGGPALVDVLFGDATPQGRLPVSWPRSVGQEPLYYDALSTGRPADGVDLTHPPATAAEKYVSRYIDEPDSPQFPFGYGLSYTTFKYGPVQTSRSQLSLETLNSALHSSGKPATVVSVAADVTNTGSRAGAETVQLYVRLQGTSIALPVRMLKGFQRVSLNPGETRKVSFDVPAKAFAFWNLRNTYGLEPAKVTVWIAPSSAEGESATLQIVDGEN